MASAASHARPEITASPEILHAIRLRVCFSLVITCGRREMNGIAEGTSAVQIGGNSSLRATVGSEAISPEAEIAPAPLWSRGRSRDHRSRGSLDPATPAGVCGIIDAAGDRGIIDPAGSAGWHFTGRRRFAAPRIDARLCRAATKMNYTLFKPRHLRKTWSYAILERSPVS